MSKSYTRPEQVIDPSQRYQAIIKTDKGSIVIDLDPGLAPRTVNNFVFLARDGFYDGLTFHRVVDGFVVQGGFPEGSGRGNPGYRFGDEPAVADYVAAPAATANSGPDSNGSPFSITTADHRRSLA